MTNLCCQKTHEKLKKQFQCHSCNSWKEKLIEEIHTDFMNIVKNNLLCKQSTKMALYKKILNNKERKLHQLQQTAEGKEE